jgi:P4 family phage/plasmid primase-like protien
MSEPPELPFGVDLNQATIDGKLKPDMLAGQITYNGPYEFVTPTTGNKSGRMWVFDPQNGFYEDNGKPRLQEIIRRILGEQKATTPIINEVVDLIKIRTQRDATEFFREDPDTITLQNGRYSISNRSFEPFSDTTNLNIRSFSKIPIIYNPDAECPLIHKFFDDVAPESKELLLEWFGYSLYKAYPVQKALMLLGEGANGKSTTNSLLGSFLGEQNIASVSLHDLENNRFAPAQLFRRHANIQSDISYEELRRASKFKSLTGGDLITAENKHEPPFQFRSYAKLAFSANALPKSLDTSYAFFRRWILVPFNRRFDKAKADSSILTKLTTPTELSGLLNLALDSLHRLLARGDFTGSESVETLRSKYELMSAPAVAFIDQCIDEDAEAYEVKSDVYKAFRLFCKFRNIVATSETSFCKSLKEGDKYVSSQYKMVNSRRQHVWSGVKLLCDTCSRRCVVQGDQGVQGLPSFFNDSASQTQ